MNEAASAPEAAARAPRMAEAAAKNFIVADGMHFAVDKQAGR